MKVTKRAAEITFPYKHVNEGVTATIYKQTQRKGEADYTSYVLAYSLLGKRKQERYTTFEEAESAADAATTAIANGKQTALELANGKKDEYLRAKEFLTPLNDSRPEGAPRITIDVACQGFAELMTLLGGRATPMEVGRFWLSKHNIEIPRVLVSEAVQKFLEQSRKDGKSDARMHQLESYLNRFKDAVNCNVTDLSPKLIGDFIIGLKVGERTKKNCRDVLVAFVDWCKGRGYLPKGEDPMENVQTYRNRKLGAISIFTPTEMKTLLEKADDRLKPYLAIRAFAGVRGEEVQRLEWQDIDLEDGFIHIHADKAKTNERRLVPIKPNLKAWLKDHAKKSGSVCPFKNVVNQLMKLVQAINEALPEDAPDSDRMKWKKNALRHSYISYRVAECADVPRVADESGNSPDVIRTNYLRRVKPAQAAEWFSITP